MNKKSPLLDYEDNWVTNLGAFFPGERVVYRGKDLFTELFDTSWMQLLLYGITGRMYSKSQVKLFDSLWALTISYPDPRLWNNRVAALAGTVRSTAGLANNSASAVSEAKIFGGKANTAAIDFIIEAKQKVSEGAVLEDIIKKELKINRGIGGYGRPVVANDERIEPALRLLKENGFEQGPHLKLAFKVEEYLKKGRWRFKMNVTGLAAAICADNDLTAREYSSFVSVAFLAGIAACYTDASEKPEGALFPISCERISYLGADYRKW